MCVCVCVFFILSSVEGHLDCFQFLASINRMAVNIAEQVSWWQDEVSFGYMPKSDVAVILR